MEYPNTKEISNSLKKIDSSIENYLRDYSNDSGLMGCYGHLRNPKTGIIVFVSAGAAKGGYMKEKCLCKIVGSLNGIHSMHEVWCDPDVLILNIVNLLNRDYNICKESSTNLQVFRKQS